ncbi:MAG: hypothetical protein AAF725_10750 [Acidobacteriota bacterium]
MTAVHIHLMLVHLPVVGVLFAAVILLFAQLMKRDLLTIVGYCTLLACAATAAAAYYSGPSAADQLGASLGGGQSAGGGDPLTDWVEQHALIAKVFFIALVLAAVLAMQALLHFFQGDAPPGWLRWVILGSVAVLCYLGAWSAHLGGAIRHVEIREPEWLIFPHLEIERAPQQDPEPAPHPR